MNVLFILFSKGWGGLEMYSIGQAREMARKGHKVAFLRRAGSPVAENLRNGNFFPGEEWSPFKYIDISAILSIRSIVKREKIDIVHVNQSADLGLAAPALWRMKNVRLIFSNYMQVPEPKNDLYHRLEYGRVERILVGSDDMRRNAIENLPVSPEKVETLPYGLKMEKFDPDNTPLGALRERYKFSKETPLIGVISRLDPLKGQMETIRAMPAILRDHPEAKLILTGGETPELAGSYKPKLEEEVKSLNLSGAVLFTGQTNDTASILADLDIYVLPSHAETFSLGCLEAMAMRKPVVGTNSGGTPEMLDHGECGLLAKPANPEALAEQINRLLADGELGESLAIKAREKVKRKYDRNVVIDRLDAIYRNDG